MGHTVHDMTALFSIDSGVSVFVGERQHYKTLEVRVAVCEQANTIKQDSFNFFLPFDQKQNMLEIENKRKCLQKIRRMEKVGRKVFFSSPKSLIYMYV